MGSPPPLLPFPPDFFVDWMTISFCLTPNEPLEIEYRNPLKFASLSCGFRFRV